MPDGDSPPDGLPPGGRYVYDPAAIRPRYRGETNPPTACAGQGEGRPHER